MHRLSLLICWKIAVLWRISPFHGQLFARLTWSSKDNLAGIRFGRKCTLTDQRKEAVGRRGNGETLAQIARSYAVSVSMISRL